MFYGWYIVGGALVAQLFMTGFMTFSFGLFVIPLEQAFGASRTEIMLGMTFSTLLGLVVAPAIGAMADKVSSRILMSIGAAIFSSGLYIMSISQNIWQFVAAFAISMCLASTLLGPIVSTAAISRWFSTTRGRALGIAATGTSIGGILIPTLVSSLLLEQSWRETLQDLALLSFVIVFPLTVIFMYSNPQERGVAGEDGAAASASTAAPAAVKGLSAKEIFATPAYWYIGLMIGILFAVYSAFLANLTPYAINAGVETLAAERLVVIAAVMGFIGKLAFGLAADKISLRLGFWIAIGLLFTAMLIYATQPGYPVIVGATVLLGLAAGGMLPVWGAIIAQVFGLVSYGRVMGWMSPLITLFVVPAFPLTGYIYDKTGNYTQCLYLFAAMLVLAFLLLLPLKLPAQD